MKLEEMKLSDQALGAIMMALQRSLLEQSDIVPILKAFKLVQHTNNELVVLNPPIVKAITAETLKEWTSESG